MCIYIKDKDHYLQYHHTNIYRSYIRYHTLVYIECIWNGNYTELT